LSLNITPSVFFLKISYYYYTLLLYACQEKKSHCRICVKTIYAKKTALPIGRAVVFYAVFKRIQAAKESEESNLLEE